MSEVVAPRSLSEAAAALAGAAAEQRPVRIVGGATKLGWGGQVPSTALRLQLSELSRVVVNPGPQMSATIAAGTPLARVQALLARSGWMVAIDPHLGLGQRPEATLGGVIATADTGPLAHRYGVVHEQLTSVTLGLADGTVLRSGPGVDAGQDRPELRSLVTGSFGTLGAILAADVKLHPLPLVTATVLGGTDDPTLLRDAALQIADSGHRLEAFDVAWRDGHGGLLAQVAGEDAEHRAAAVASQMRERGLSSVAVRTDDAPLWARQRAGQRSAQRAVIRVTVRRSQLDAALALADACQGTVVGRATLGVLYLTTDVNQVAAVRSGLPDGSGAVVLDLPQTARGAVDVWGMPEGPELDAMRGVKDRFDPASVCNPGIFPGRI